MLINTGTIRSLWNSLPFYFLLLEACDFKNHLPFRGVTTLRIHLRSLWVYLFLDNEVPWCDFLPEWFSSISLAFSSAFLIVVTACSGGRRVTLQVFLCLLKHLSSESGKDAHGCSQREAFFFCIHWEAEKDTEGSHCCLLPYSHV